MSKRATVFSFFIDQLPMTRNEADRKHWSELANEKKLWLFLIRQAVGNYKAVEPCRVTITFRTLRKNDEDNLFARCKSPLDALQRAGIITNDDPDTITLTVKQELVKRGNVGTLIEFLPLDDEEAQ